VATSSYDVVEYPGGVFAQTHPARLAAIARLHGVPAASPRRCRLLEIGTADGENLFPLALAYPDSEFVGIDLAEAAIVKGNAVRNALGVKNLTLLAVDLCSLPDSFGPFDYVVAHGVFSWVPDVVRDGLLDLCRRVLAPHGVAYVSYNAQPGGHISQMLSEMMRYHIRNITDPGEQIQHARGLMRMVHEGTNVPDPLGGVLKTEARRVFNDFSDAVLYHDDLAELNNRYYFHEFARLTDKFGLQFLAEADYHELTNLTFPPDVAAALDALGKKDRVQEEQYRDFLCLRRFRQSLLVRSDVAVNRDARIASVSNFSVSANPMTPAIPDPDLSAGVRLQFDTVKGSRVTVDHPLAKAALLELSARPLCPMSMPAVLTAATARLGAPPAVDATDADFVYAMFFQAFQVGMVHFTVDPPTFAIVPGPMPRLSPLTRYQLDTGRDFVTTLRHSVVRIETQLTRQLLLACNGTRDRDGILDVVTGWAVTQPPGEGQTAPTREQLRASLAAELEPGLDKAADLALFVE
jgi:SAM-dependent methyltransferase